MAKYCAHDADGSGDGSFASPWTLDQALASLTNSDTLYLLNTGTYALTGATRSFTNVGTGYQPLRIVGVSADGTTPEVATISGESMNASSDILYSNVTSIFLFVNVRLTSAQRYGINQGSGGGIGFSFFNSQIDSCLSHGVYAANSSGSFYFERCRLNNNGGCGYAVTSSSRGRMAAVDSSFDGNASHGVYDSNGTSFGVQRPSLFRCIVARNGGDGLRLYTATDSNYGLRLLNNTFACNAGDGVNVLGAQGDLFFNLNIFKDNGAYAIRLNSATLDRVNAFNYNCAHGNTSGLTDINSGTLPGIGNISSDPRFAVLSDGSDYFSPRNSDLLVGFDFPYGGKSHLWMGAVQPCPSQIARVRMG